MKKANTAINIVFACMLLQMHAIAQDFYKIPPQEIVDIVDAPAAPSVVMSPRGNAMLLVETRAHPSIALLARPFQRLAGLRIDPALKARRRSNETVSYNIMHFHDGKQIPVKLPEHARLGTPSWSHDGRWIAFTRDGERGVELWVADANTGQAKQIHGVLVNDLFGTPFSWMRDNRRLLVRARPLHDGPAPVEPITPVGPIVDQTHGVVSRPPTYQDLLRSQYDEELFAYYAQTQLMLIDVVSASVEAFGAPDMIMGATFSPDERYLLVNRLQRPFSSRVPYSLFSRVVEIQNTAGAVIATVADLPIADRIPTHGVQTGPRSVVWQELLGSTLIWVEALDGGDPMRDVPYRDRVMRFASPFGNSPAKVMKLQHRFSGFTWLDTPETVLLSEFDRSRRWRTTSLIDLTAAESTRRVLFDLSANDAYNNPGSPVMHRREDGASVVVQDGNWLYFRTGGASDEGRRPRLDRWHILTLERETIFESPENRHDSFISFVEGDKSKLVLRSESPLDAPNYILFSLDDSLHKVLTSFTDPAPHLTGVRKQLLRYKRSDGAALSGVLYYPPQYQPGMRYPLVIWAYPREYSDPSTAGQVRSSPNSFTFFRGTTPLMLLTQGYAVLMDATMPVIGDADRMNDTFIEQIVNAGRAAIDTLDAMGVIDRERVLLMGHSYGAFMTANLLAHTDDYAAGVARSGAYNRTLTPFGFQSERRSFWEAPELYIHVSPFRYADNIKAPLLIIHGVEDNNPGTYTIQSERLFQAIRGNGGTARLVLLPHEGHSYIARESVLHTIAEMIEWAETHVKQRTAPSEK